MYAQGIFSVSAISEDDFNSIAEQYSGKGMTGIAMKDSALRQTLERQSFELFNKINETEYKTPEQAGEAFQVDSILYFETLDMYAACASELHDFPYYWFDSSAKLVGYTPYPFFITDDGFIVSQRHADCDVSLDLQFYCKSPHGFICAYKFESRLYGEALEAYYLPPNGIVIECAYGSSRYLKITFDNTRNNYE